MDAGLLRSSEPAAVEVNWKLRGKTHWKRRAKAARRSSRLYAQSLSSEVSPKQCIPAQRRPPGAPEEFTGSASQEGICRLLRSQPRRLGSGQPRQARPPRGCANISRGFLPALRTGTFYLAGNRNFLFGSDSLADSLPPFCRSFAAVCAACTVRTYSS